MIEYFRVAKGLLEQLQETQQAAIGAPMPKAATVTGTPSKVPPMVRRPRLSLNTLAP